MLEFAASVMVYWLLGLATAWVGFVVWYKVTVLREKLKNSVERRKLGTHYPAGMSEASDEDAAMLEEIAQVKRKYQ